MHPLCRAERPYRARKRDIPSRPPLGSWRGVADEGIRAHGLHRSIDMFERATILVATDFSPDADAALDEAVALAKALRSRIHLVHSFHVTPHVHSPAWGSAYRPDWFEDLRSDTQRRLRERKDKVAAAGVEVDAQLVTNVPSVAIRDLARQLPADLIVMGTRGLTGLKHVVLGSVAERTARIAPCPVLTVQARNAEAAA